MNALDAALVPADVVSVAVKARTGRQVRRGEAPGAGAARGRGAKRRSAAIRHRHRGTIRCGSRQGHQLIVILRAGANHRRGRGWRRLRRSIRRQRDIVEIPLAWIIGCGKLQRRRAARGRHGVGVFRVAGLRRVAERKQRLPVPYRCEVVSPRPLVLQPEAQRISLAGRRRDGLASGAVRAH